MIDERLDRIEKKLDQLLERTVRDTARLDRLDVVSWDHERRHRESERSRWRHNGAAAAIGALIASAARLLQ